MKCMGGGGGQATTQMEDKATNRQSWTQVDRFTIGGYSHTISTYK